MLNVRDPNELRNAETGLKISAVVIPKEDLAETSPAKAAFGMTPTTEYNL